MMNFTRIFTTVMLVAVTLPLLFLLTPKAQAFDLFGKACTGKAANSPICKDKNQGISDGRSDNAITRVIKTAANLIALIAGAGAVIVIIISGYNIITAGGSPAGQRSGDSNKVKSARSAIVGALIGLAVIALSWTIIRFITDVILK